MNNNNNNNDSSNGPYTENPCYCQVCGNSDILYETQFDCTRKSTGQFLSSDAPNCIPL